MFWDFGGVVGVRPWRVHRRYYISTRERGLPGVSTFRWERRSIARGHVTGPAFFSYTWTTWVGVCICAWDPRTPVGFIFGDAKVGYGVCGSSVSVTHSGLDKMVLFW